MCSQLCPPRLIFVSQGYASPDFARAQLMDALHSVTDSFYLMIYQITDSELCDKLADMQSNGIDLNILLSRRIYAYNDYKLAQVSERGNPLGERRSDDNTGLQRTSIHGGKGGGSFIYRHNRHS